MASTYFYVELEGSMQRACLQELQQGEVVTKPSQGVTENSITK